jgi:hypothetical protein
MGAGRWTWPPGETLRARLAMCGALGRASVKSGAANQRNLNMSTPSLAKSRNPKSAASKKRSVQSSATARRKVTSAATPAKVPPKRDEPKVERATKRERLLTLLGHAEGASKAASRRKRHGEEEARFSACHFESGRRRPPLPH